MTEPPLNAPSTNVIDRTVSAIDAALSLLSAEERKALATRVRLREVPPAVQQFCETVPQITDDAMLAAMHDACVKFTALRQQLDDALSSGSRASWEDFFDRRRQEGVRALQEIASEFGWRPGDDILQTAVYELRRLHGLVKSRDEAEEREWEESKRRTEQVNANRRAMNKLTEKPSPKRVRVTVEQDHGPLGVTVREIIAARVPNTAFYRMEGVQSVDAAVIECGSVSDILDALPRLHAPLVVAIIRPGSDWVFSGVLNFGCVYGGIHVVAVNRDGEGRWVEEVAARIATALTVDK